MSPELKAWIEGLLNTMISTLQSGLASLQSVPISGTGPTEPPGPTGPTEPPPSGGSGDLIVHGRVLTTLPVTLTANFAERAYVTAQSGHATIVNMSMDGGAYVAGPRWDGIAAGQHTMHFKDGKPGVTYDIAARPDPVQGA